MSEGDNTYKSRLFSERTSAIIANFIAFAALIVAVISICSSSASGLQKAGRNGEGRS